MRATKQLGEKDLLERMGEMAQRSKKARDQRDAQD
jgi:hypothetical protein